MPVTLRQQPVTLRPLNAGLSAYDPLAEQRGLAAATSEIGKGWTAAGIGESANGLWDAANAAYARGDQLRGANLERQARDLSAQAQVWAPRVQDFSAIQNVGDTVDWASGALGNVRSSLPPLLGGLAGAGLGLAAAPFTGGVLNPLTGAKWGSGLGAGLVGYNMETNEAIAQAMQDPTIRQTKTMDEIRDAARVKGGINAGLEALVPMGVAGSLASLGKNAVKGAAAPHLAKAFAKNAGEEFLTEGAQEVVGAGTQNYLKDQPLTDIDPTQVLNAAMAGAVAGGGMGAVGGAADVGWNKVLGGGTDEKGGAKDDTLLGRLGTKAGALLGKGVNKFEEADLESAGRRHLADVLEAMANRDRTEERVTSPLSADEKVQSDEAILTGRRQDADAMVEKIKAGQFSDEVRAAADEYVKTRDVVKFGEALRTAKQNQQALDADEKLQSALGGNTKSSKMRAELTDDQGNLAWRDRRDDRVTDDHGNLVAGREDSLGTARHDRAAQAERVKAESAQSKTGVLADLLRRDGIAAKIVDAVSGRAEESQRRTLASLMQWVIDGMDDQDGKTAEALAGRFGERAPKVVQRAYEIAREEHLENLPEPEHAAAVLGRIKAAHVERTRVRDGVLAAMPGSLRREMTAEDTDALIEKLQEVVDRGTDARGEAALRKFFGSDTQVREAMSFLKPPKGQATTGGERTVTSATDEEGDRIESDEVTEESTDDDRRNARPIEPTRRHAYHAQSKTNEYFDLRNAFHKAQLDRMKGALTQGADHVERSAATVGILDRELEKAAEAKGVSVEELPTQTRAKVIRDTVSKFYPKLRHVGALSRDASPLARQLHEKEKQRYLRALQSHARQINRRHVALRIDEAEASPPGTTFSPSDVRDLHLQNRDLKTTSPAQGTLVFERSDAKTPFITSAPALLRKMYQVNDGTTERAGRTIGDALSNLYLLEDAIASLMTYDGPGYAFTQRIGYVRAGQITWLKDRRDLAGGTQVIDGRMRWVRDKTAAPRVLLAAQLPEDLFLIERKKDGQRVTVGMALGEAKVQRTRERAPYRIDEAENDGERTNAIEEFLDRRVLDDHVVQPDLHGNYPKGARPVVSEKRRELVELILERDGVEAAYEFLAGASRELLTGRIVTEVTHPDDMIRLLLERAWEKRIVEERGKDAEGKPTHERKRLVGAGWKLDAKTRGAIFELWDRWKKAGMQPSQKLVAAVIAQFRAIHPKYTREQFVEMPERDRVPSENADTTGPDLPEQEWGSLKYDPAQSVGSNEAVTKIERDTAGDAAGLPGYARTGLPGSVKGGKAEPGPALKPGQVPRRRAPEPKGLYDILAAATRETRFGTQPDPIAQEIIKSASFAKLEKALEQLQIKGVLGAGASSIILNTDRGALRLGLGKLVAPIASQHVLQPIKTAQYGDLRVELMPKAETQGITEADVKTVEQALAKDGLVLTDAGTDNVGRVDGKLVVIDPGAVEKAKPTAEPQAAPAADPTDRLVNTVKEAFAQAKTKRAKLDVLFKEYGEMLSDHTEPTMFGHRLTNTADGALGTAKYLDFLAGELDALQGLSEKQVKALFDMATKLDRAYKVSYQKTWMEVLEEAGVPDYLARRGTKSSNKQANPDRKQASAEAQQAAIDELKKVLGDTVKVEFKAWFRDGTSGRWTERAEKNVIEIALNGDVLGTAFHESLHEFFSILTKHGADNVKAQLLRVASTASMQRRLMRLLDGHPAAQAQVMSDPEEALAYMYQFWRMNKLELGPQTSSMFEQFKALLRRLFKRVQDEVQDEQHAEQILATFAAGAFGKADAPMRAALVKAMVGSSEAHDKALASLGRGSQKLINNYGKLVFSAEAMMDATKNPYVERIARAFHQKYGEAMGGQQAFLDAVRQNTNRWMNDLEQILLAYDPKDLERARQVMASGMRSTDPVVKEIVHKIMGHNTGFFDRIWTFLQPYGMQRKNDKGQWEDVPYRRDYFSQVWDTDLIQKQAKEFAADLVRVHRKDLERIVKDVNREIEKKTPGGKNTVSREQLGLKPEDREEVTVEMVADAIVLRILNTGKVDLDETESQIGMTPMAAAVNQRGLTWLDGETFDKYKSKDLAMIMTTYVKSMVKRAEYQARFGPGGEKLQNALDKAYIYELGGHALVKEARAALPAAIEAWQTSRDKAQTAAERLHVGEKPTLRSVAQKLREQAVGREPMLAELKAAEENLRATRQAIMAFEGTLGSEISPTARALNSGLVTYQTIRLLSLSLFTSINDILGPVVNGGKLSDAWDTLVRGVREIRLQWKGERSTDGGARRAEAFGTVDAGTFLDALGQTYGSMYMTTKMKRINDRFFRLIGMEGWNRAMRIQATAVGERLILEWVKNGVNRNDPAELARFERLYGKGAKPEQIVLDPDGNLDVQDARNRAAVNRFVLDSVITPNAATRPIWGSDPHYQALFHLKNYTYTFHRVMMNGAMKQASLGNYRPAMVLMLGYAPVMIVAGAIKEMLIPGEEPPWMQGGLDGYLAYGWSKAGVLGVPQMIDGTVRDGWAPKDYGFGALDLLGPTVSQLRQATFEHPAETLLSALPAGNLFQRLAPK